LVFITQMAPFPGHIAYSTRYTCHGHCFLTTLHTVPGTQFMVTHGGLHNTPSDIDLKLCIPLAWFAHAGEGRGVHVRGAPRGVGTDLPGAGGSGAHGGHRRRRRAPHASSVRHLGVDTSGFSVKGFRVQG